MGKVHDDACPVHLPHDVLAYVGQAGETRRFGLGVADLVGVIVHDGDRPHAVGMGGMDPFEPVLDEIPALDGEDRGGLPGRQRLADLDGSPAGRGLAARDHRLQKADLAAVVRPGFARLELTRRAQAARAGLFQEDRVRNAVEQRRADAACGHGRQGLSLERRPHGASGRVLAGQVTKEEAPGVGMDVDGRMLAQQYPAGLDLRRREAKAGSGILRVEDGPLGEGGTGCRAQPNPGQQLAAREARHGETFRTSPRMVKIWAIWSGVMIKGGESARVSPVTRTTRPAFSAATMAS